MNLDGVKNVVIGITTIFTTLTNQNIPTPPVDFPPHPLSEQMYQDFHHDPVPYLTLPFKPGVNYEVTEGWIYSDEELAIHGGNPIHGGVDLHAPYGTEVVSPVDGYAMSSYHTEWIREGRDPKEEVKDDNEEYKKPIKLYQGKPMREGLGYFIYIYVPIVNRFIELGHLSDIDPAIPFSPPVYNPKTDGWDPTNYQFMISQIDINTNIVPVKKGQVIGKVGFSGLALGDSDKESWDEPHIHFEEFYIDQETGQKGWQRDPYALYDTFERYNIGKMGLSPLWLLDQNNLPQFTQ